jgi:hypothetical protein
MASGQAPNRCALADGLREILPFRVVFQAHPHTRRRHPASPCSFLRWRSHTSGANRRVSQNHPQITQMTQTPEVKHGWAWKTATAPRVPFDSPRHLSFRAPPVIPSATCHSELVEESRPGARLTQGKPRAPWDFPRFPSSATLTFAFCILQFDLAGAARCRVRSLRPRNSVRCPPQVPPF